MSILSEAFSHQADACVILTAMSRTSIENKIYFYHINRVYGRIVSVVTVFQKFNIPHRTMKYIGISLLHTLLPNGSQHNPSALCSL